MSEWKTIETAPSDGQRVIVIGGRHDEPEIVKSDGDWWRSSAGLVGIPTHWMELPAPPA